MFRFFTQKNWFLWSWIGSAIILSSLWIQVKIDVKINEWFGEFYDMIQKALGAPNSITIEEYWASLLSFITLAAMYVGVAVVVSFFTSHYLFRWRTAMVEWYHSVYDKARKIEGAAQRVQEDTIKFSRIMESLGTSLIEALMILVEFMPILFGLSIGIPIFFFGDWDYGLIVGALIWSVGGTIFLILLGLILRLVGVEYDLQKKEAAYRKILVIAEDDGTIRPKTIDSSMFEVGTFVENVNTGVIGKIVSRGSNHVIYIDENDNVYRAWLKDLVERIDIKLFDFTPAGEMGTDKLANYMRKLTPGEFIRKINKKDKDA